MAACWTLNVSRESRAAHGGRRRRAVHPLTATSGASERGRDEDAREKGGGIGWGEALLRQVVVGRRSRPPVCERPRGALLHDDSPINHRAHGTSRSPPRHTPSLSPCTAVRHARTGVNWLGFAPSLHPLHLPLRPSSPALLACCLLPPPSFALPHTASPFARRRCRASLRPLHTDVDAAVEVPDE